MASWGVRPRGTSFEVSSVVDGGPGTWRRCAPPVEFLPMLQPSTDALPHLIPTKAPTGTGYSSTRRGYAHKRKITQLASVRARTETQFHLKPKSLCVFFFPQKHERLNQGFLKSLPALRFCLSLHVDGDMSVGFLLIPLASVTLKWQSVTPYPTATSTETPAFVPFSAERSPTSIWG